MPYRKPLPAPEPSCTRFHECLLSNPDPAALALLAVGASVFLFLAAFALAHIAGARSVLETERERVAAEAEAFGAFARRVAALDAAGTNVAAEAPGATTALEATTTTGRTQRVRDAYRETVMALDHYEAEYGEPLATNMAIEFGEDVATAVASGSALTPQLRDTLVERSKGARRQRVLLLRQLEAEGESLEDAASELATVQRSVERLEDAPLEEYAFDELNAEWHLVEDRLQETEAVLAGRQETIQNRDRDGPRPETAPSFEEYLYEPMEVTYPVLAEGSSLLERLRGVRRRVERALAATG